MSTHAAWVFDRDTCELFLDRDGVRYYRVDLEKIRDCATALDWIAQLARKGMYSDAEIGAYVRKLDELFDFQSSQYVHSGSGYVVTDVRSHIEVSLQERRKWARRSI